MKRWGLGMLYLGVFLATIVLCIGLSKLGTMYNEGQRVRDCNEGKFKYQVLADCSRINGCSFGPEELDYARNLTQNCREGE